MYSKRLKQMLLLMVTITSGALLMVFLGYRHLLNRINNQVLPFQSEVSIAISHVHQTATRNGITEWCLDADSAQYINATNQASFKDPSLTFFLDNQQKVNLTAKQGILNTVSKDMRVTDGVTMNYSQYQLKTDTLYYAHEKRIIYSDVPVEITDDIVCIHADSMVFDLKTNQTKFEGNVETTIREPI